MEHKSNSANSSALRAKERWEREAEGKSEQNNVKHESEKKECVDRKIDSIEYDWSSFFMAFQFAHTKEWKKRLLLCIQSRVCYFLTLNYHARQFYECVHVRVSDLTMSPLSMLGSCSLSLSFARLHARSLAQSKLNDELTHPHRMPNKNGIRQNAEWGTCSPCDQIIIIPIVCQIIVELLELWPIS